MLHAFNLINLNPCKNGANIDVCFLKKYLEGRGRTCEDCLKGCKEVDEYWKMENEINDDV